MGDILSVKELTRRNPSTAKILGVATILCARALGWYSIPQSSFSKTTGGANAQGPGNLAARDILGATEGGCKGRVGTDETAFVSGENSLLGPPVVCKTHLAVALGMKACEQGHRVLFTTAMGLLALLGKAISENRLDEKSDGSQWMEESSDAEKVCPPQPVERLASC